MPTATTDPLVGRALEGRYRIGDRIARGGMSTVYTAVDERLDRMVAVKVMSDALSADPAFSDRFAREARAAARLAHVNAVAVYDQGEDGGHVFLVMELVPGRTLRDLLRERGRLSPAQAVSVMEPVLGALAAAHRAGLVHRDIKPENILLSDEGLVKVADFGLARAVESGDSTTRTGLMMGTVAYCSPEQIVRGRTDQRSDVYSAGVVLYELLTGGPPYSGSSAVQVAYQHVHSQVPAPSAKAKGIPPQLDDLVRRATSNDAGGRPLDAGAFLAELSDVRADLDLPIVAIPPRRRTNGDSPGAPNGRRPTGRTPGEEFTTDPLHPFAGTHDTAVEPGRAPMQRPRPVDEAAEGPPPPIVVPPPRRRSRHRRLRRTLLGLFVVLLLGAGAGVGGWWFVSGRFAKVPDVTRNSVATATSTLDKAGLHEAPPQTEFSETVAKGLIIRTDPRAGKRLRRGTTVTLIVSAGKERYTVPDVSNQTEAAARVALNAFPLTLVSTQAASDTVKAGLVISTNPVAGTAVKRNQTVTLVVSSGPPMLSVADVTNNQTQDAATATLKAQGFVVAVQQAYSDTVASGVVISENPAAGASAVKFSTVTIVVSQGPQYVDLPAVAGKTSEVATQLLRNAGFNVVVQRVFGGNLDVTVGMAAAAADKNAAGQVRKGATVTISVA